MKACQTTIEASEAGAVAVETRSRLDRILEVAFREGAILRGGPFKLSSGKTSDHYYDGKMLTLSPEGAYLVGKEIFDRLKDQGIQAVGGLTMGADMIATAVALVSYQEGNPIQAFIVRKDPKSHGTRKMIEGHLPAGARVAIVDDVVTTGLSVLRAIEAVSDEGCQVARVLAIVDRCEGGGDELRRKGYEFTPLFLMPDAGGVVIAET